MKNLKQKFRDQGVTGFFPLNFTEMCFAILVSWNVDTDIQTDNNINTQTNKYDQSICEQY